MTRKRKAEVDNTAPTMSDKIAEKVAGTCMRVQKSFADNMNKALERMSNRQLKMALVLFCLIAGGYSLYLIVNAITTHPKTSGVLNHKEN